MELVILMGLPGSGKTSFFRACFASTHAHVSKDLMGPTHNRSARQQRLVEEALRGGGSVVVDNINARPEDRAPLIALARAHGASVKGYLLETDVRQALARNRKREGKARVPDVAIFVASKRLQLPKRTEGFDELFRVKADGGEFEVQPWE